MNHLLDALRPLTCQDFIQYYSAGSLYLANRNPYNPELLHESQGLICSTAEMPRLPWIPPHLVQLSSPLSLLNPEIAWTLWSLLGIAAVVYVINDLRRIYPNIETTDSLLLSSLYLPVLLCLTLGQLGLFLMLGCWLIFRGISTGNAGILAIGVVLSSFKPHLFLILYAVVLVPTVFQNLRQYRRAVLGSAGFLVFSILMDSSVWINWIDAFGKPQINAPTVHEWIPHTISGLLRAVTKSIELKFTAGAISTLGLIAAWRINRTRRFESSSATESLGTFYILLSVSYLFAPYGWIQDQPVLLPLFLTTLWPSSFGSSSYVPTRPKRACLVIGSLSALMGLSLLNIHNVPGRTALFTLTFPCIAIYVASQLSDRRRTAQSAPVSQTSDRSDKIK